MFIIMISLPLILMVAGVKSSLTLDENRNLEQLKFSELKPSNVVEKVENYINDHFGLRAELIYLGRLQVLKMDAHLDQKVLIGKEGWLFYKDDNGLNDYRNTKPYSIEELEHIYKKIVSYVQKSNDLGARFILMIPPNALTIYGQRYAPDWIEKLNESSRLDQLKKYLQERKIEIADSREILKAKIDKEQLYFKTDTHWTMIGAYFGYYNLMEKLFLEPKPLVEFRRVKKVQDFFDLTKMLGPMPIREEYIELEPLEGWKSKPNTSMSENRKHKYYSCLDCGNHTALVIHDSFMGNMLGFLNEHFQSVHYVKDNQIDWELVQKEKPDYLILELVERKTYSWVPK